MTQTQDERAKMLREHAILRHVEAEIKKLRFDFAGVFVRHTDLVEGFGICCALPNGEPTTPRYLKHYTHPENNPVEMKRLVADINESISLTIKNLPDLGPPWLDSAVWKPQQNPNFLYVRKHVSAQVSIAQKPDGKYVCDNVEYNTIHQAAFDAIRRAPELLYKNIYHDQAPYNHGSVRKSMREHIEQMNALHDLYQLACEHNY